VGEVPPVPDMLGGGEGSRSGGGGEGGGGEGREREIEALKGEVSALRDALCRRAGVRISTDTPTQATTADSGEGDGAARGGRLALGGNNHEANLNQETRDGSAAAEDSKKTKDSSAGAQDAADRESVARPKTLFSQRMHATGADLADASAAYAGECQQTRKHWLYADVC
jgi:hypothetical protein